MAQMTTVGTAEIVRVELARRRLAGRQLARALGWSTSTTARRLRGEQPFTVDELVAVAKVLDMPVAELIPEQPAALGSGAA